MKVFGHGSNSLFFHAMKEGGISYPSDLSLYSNNFQWLPPLRYSFLIPLASDLTGTVQNQCQQSLLWQIAPERISKQSQCNHLSPVLYYGHKTAWSDLPGNVCCPESLFWKAWFGVLPLAWKQPEKLWELWMWSLKRTTMDALFIASFIPTVPAVHRTYC